LTIVIQLLQSFPLQVPALVRDPIRHMPKVIFPAERTEIDAHWCADIVNPAQVFATPFGFAIGVVGPFPPATALAKLFSFDFLRFLVHHGAGHAAPFS
jgi:hypothetical protein